MNSFGSKASLSVQGKSYSIYKIDAVKSAGLPDPKRLPFSIRILLENLLRNEDGVKVEKKDIEAICTWDPKVKSDKEIAFTPARVILQDFTGVPAVVDLAAMRDKLAKMGGDANQINPLEQVDLVIDHSVQVDYYGSDNAFEQNVEKEMQRNKERYQFLRWGQSAFQNFRVVPPGTGIVHQVNLENLASCVFRKEKAGETVAYPDTLVGTDSHTTMINGLGVLGWGVGGIEAEAAMLGQPISMLIPEVVGFKLTGKLPEGATATDLVLMIVQMLREKGVVGKFVEFYGPGLDVLPLADRATIANMAPEYGATMGIFPVDEKTIDYLKLTARSEETIALTEAYYKEQGLFRTAGDADPEFTDTLELDMSSVVPSLAGPKRPQDRIALNEMKDKFQRDTLPTLTKGELKAPRTADVKNGGENFTITDGSVVIAAITSCTNTSNPAVMVGAGLVAKKAVEKGLTSKPWVKTSLAPGSKVVADYLKETGLLPYLERLNFHLVGFGCTTCIGNSGPLAEPISDAIKEKDLVATSVLSGNRNFEGRINPFVKANYLASPPLVVAYALAGVVDKDLATESLGKDRDGNPVYLKDIWPTNNEVHEAMSQVSSKMFAEQYANVFDGDAAWQAIEAPTGATFSWDDASTYVKNPPYFDDMGEAPGALTDIEKARVLVMVGDSVTTDHISPAGAIQKEGPAGKYLIENGVDPKDFNSYGSRRGNHEVMMRGTFANIRLRNLLAPGTEGGVTRHLPDGEQMSIYDASVKYKSEGTPLIVIAGKEYGTGSSRDWAAKGPYLLGIKAVIAESYERIHRSNLIGMGILPLQFEAGAGRESLGLTGEEEFTIEGIAEGLEPGKKIVVKAGDKIFTAICRIDTPVELEYYRHGGILQFVLRQLMESKVDAN